MESDIFGWSRVIFFFGVGARDKTWSRSRKIFRLTPMHWGGKKSSDKIKGQKKKTQAIKYMVEKIKGRKKSSNKIGPIPFYRPIPILPAPRKKSSKKKSL